MIAKALADVFNLKQGDLKVELRDPFTPWEELRPQFVNWLHKVKDEFNVTVQEDMSDGDLVRFTTANMDRLVPQRLEANGGWKNGQSYYYEISRHNGRIILQLALNSEKANELQKKGLQKIVAASEYKPRSQNWTWFVANKWQLNDKKGDKELLNSLHKVLNEDVAVLEKSLL